MKNFLRISVVLLISVFASEAMAQTGQLQPGQAWGNGTGAQAPASGVTVQQLLSQQGLTSLVINGATSLGAGSIVAVNNQNATTPFSITNTSTGVNSFAGFLAYNSNGNATFGVGGSGYTTIAALQNKATVFANSALGGVIVYAQGTNPIDFWTNGARAGGFTSGGVFSLGVAGSSAGALSFNNATSGSITIQPTTGALGSAVWTVPAGTDTFAGISSGQTLTNKTISGSSNTLSNIANASLTNSTISGIALGSNLATLTYGTHLTNSAGASSYNGSAASTLATDATSANTASTIVARDGSGNFSAGAITAATSLTSPVHTASGALTFESNGSTFAGAINASQQWYIGTSNVSPPATSLLTVSGNAAALPAFSVTNAPQLQVASADGARSMVAVRSFGGVAGTLAFTAAAGTAASPTATLSGAGIGLFVGYGYQTTTNAYNTGGAGFQIATSENSTSTSNGTELQIYTTPNTTATTTLAGKFQASGGLTIGSSACADKGAGSINICGGAFYANGTAVSGTGTVTSVGFTAGTGISLSGTNPITGSGTITINNTGVTSVAGGYGISGGTITTTGTLAVSLTTATNSLGGNVSLSSTSTFFDGPSMAQGGTGTWAVYGQATVEGSTTDTIYCKLWDGTTVIDSGVATTLSNAYSVIALSGNLSSPAGNIKISCKDTSTTSGLIIANVSGGGKDSTISGHRIQ